MSTLSHCRVHPEENSQFKCLYHNAFICSLCATTSHKRCDDVIHIDKIPIEKRKDGKECLSKLISMKESVEKLLASKLNDAEELESITSKNEMCLNALTERMQSIAVHMETDLMADYKGKIDSERNKVLSSIVNFTEYIDTLTNYHFMAENISKYWSNTQKAVFLELLTETENKIRNDLKKQDSFALYDVANKISVELVTLQSMLKSWEKDFYAIKKKSSDKHSSIENFLPLDCPSKTTETCEKNQEEATFTKAEKVNPCITTTPVARVDTPTGEVRTVEKKIILSSNYSCKKISAYDISLPGVSCKVSSHIGILRLANNNLVILDKNNKIVKLVAPNFRICSHRKLEDEPVDICHIKYDKIGVATAKKIVVFSISGNKVWSCYDFLVKGQENLLSFCSGSNLTLLFRGKNNANTYLQVRTKENKIIVDLTKFYDRSGKSLTLEKPSFVRQRHPEEVIVCEHRHLSVIDREGKITRRFTDDALKSINYIAVDSKIGIFLCDTDAGMIHLLSLDMYSASRVLITDIEKPASIIFDNGLRRLYIGCLNNNMVYVYQLT